MEKSLKGQNLKGESKDKEGDFSPISKYSGKADELAKFKLQVEHYARGVRITHDHQIKAGEGGYDGADGRTADDQAWISVEDTRGLLNENKVEVFHSVNFGALFRDTSQSE